MSDDNEREIWDDTPDDDDAVRIPVRGLQMAELVTATGLSHKRIEKLIREGLPAIGGATKKARRRFDLPAVFAWFVDGAGADADPLVAAKRRQAIATAEKMELANRRIAGSVIDADLVRDSITKNVAELRGALLEIPLRLTAQSSEVRAAVKKEIEDSINRMSFEEMEWDR